MRQTAVMVLWTLSLAAIVALGSDGDGRPATQVRRRPMRFRAEMSDMLTHSTLDTCRVDDASAQRAHQRVRVATWNIRAARSASVNAVADELKAIGADVIALQEVDVRTRRAGFVDQPEFLARALGFGYAFAASIKWDGGDYGLAVLSRWPLTDLQRHRLDSSAGGEPRIVLEVGICAGGRPLRLFDHHADRRAASRNAGFIEVQRIVRAALGRGLLILGDFNELPDASGVRGLVDEGLVDLGAARNVSTSAGGRIDYVMADPRFARLASSHGVWTTSTSDHHAVFVDLEW